MLFASWAPPEGKLVASSLFFQNTRSFLGVSGIFHIQL